MTESGHELTQLLQLWAGGDRSAFDRLLPLVYRELKKMAKRSLRQQSPGHTLQTTDVVHEVYLKLVAAEEQSFQNRDHFLAVAATAMRQLLVDHARARGAAKRGGHLRLVSLEDIADGAPAFETRVLVLNESLDALAALNPRQARVVELRYFGGSTVEQAARILDVSPETVARDWRLARAFLRRELAHGGSD